MPDPKISYRHDTGPWLNAEQRFWQMKPAGLGQQVRAAFVALEDLWI
jgi:hypothetical protein